MPGAAAGGVWAWETGGRKDTGARAARAAGGAGLGCAASLGAARLARAAWALAEAAAAAAGVGAAPAIAIERLRRTPGVERHAGDIVGRGPFRGERARPFLDNSSLLIQEIIRAVPARPDPRGGSGGFSVGRARLFPGKVGHVGVGDRYHHKHHYPFQFRDAISMEFEVIYDRPILRGAVIYDTQYHSFDFVPAEPRDESSVSSVLLDDLELEISDLHRVLWASGYCPYAYWKRARLVPPMSRSGRLVAAIDPPVVPGASVRIARPGIWPVIFDPNSRWVCIGSAEPAVQDEAVEFAADSIAVVRNGTLSALWLHPMDLSPVVHALG